MKRKYGVLDAVNTTLLAVVLFLCAYPLWYVFIYTISDPLLAQTGVFLLPKGLSFNNYVRIFGLENLGNSMIVSLARTAIGAGLTVLLCSMFGYLLSRENMRLRKLVYRLVVATMYLNAGLIAIYLTYSMLGLRNNFLVYILPSSIQAFYVILFKTSIEGLPRAVEESAMIDGAWHFTVFFRIVLPMSLPIVATVAVFSAVSHWNSWIDSLLYIKDQKLFTAQYVLYNYLNQAEAIARQLKDNPNRPRLSGQLTPQAVKMTITMVVTLPVLFVYPFFQRFFIKGLVVGAVKG